MEPWAERIRQGIEGSRPTVLVATEGMALVKAPGAGEQAPLDPHVWLDPLLASQQVQAIAKALQSLDPEHAQEYAANADAYLRRLDEVHQKYVEGLRACKSRVLVTSHAFVSYLASQYGLKTIAIAGLSPEAEPSPGRLAQLVEEIKAQGVTAVYFESLVNPAVAETLARETGVQALALNPIEGLTPQEQAQGIDYLTLMRANLVNLRQGLRCN